MNFKIADVYQDAKILKQANEAADWLIETDHERLKKLPKYEEPSSVII
jgi:ATP-dependent DNA helicase RecG